MTQAVMQPWVHYLLAFDTVPVLRRVRVPVLAVNGTLDLQVPHSENLKAIRRALTAAGNRDHTEEATPGLNHLFQHATTGLVSEYATIEDTGAPAVLDRILAWLSRLPARRHHVIRPRR